MRSECVREEEEEERGEEAQRGRRTEENNAAPVGVFLVAEDHVLEHCGRDAHDLQMFRVQSSAFELGREAAVEGILKRW